MGGLSRHRLHHHLPPPLTIYEEEVRNTFRGLQRNKAAGPDNMSPSVLHHCAAELAGVFTNIFSTSLCQSSVPKCFKESVIIPDHLLPQ